jgi:hypothetical protein
VAARVIVGGLSVAGLLLFPSHPLTSLVLFVAALAIVMDTRRMFGVGSGRAMLAFVSGLFLVLGGVALTLVGLVPEGIPCEPPDCPTAPGNFLLMPGLLLLGAGLGLLAWSVVGSILLRRRYGS